MSSTSPAYICKNFKGYCYIWCKKNVLLSLQRCFLPPSSYLPGCSAILAEMKTICSKPIRIISSARRLPEARSLFIIHSRIPRLLESNTLPYPSEPIPLTPTPYALPLKMRYLLSVPTTADACPKKTVWLMIYWNTTSNSPQSLLPIPCTESLWLPSPAHSHSFRFFCQNTSSTAAPTSTPIWSFWPKHRNIFVLSWNSNKPDPKPGCSWHPTPQTISSRNARLLLIWLTKTTCTLPSKNA